MNIQALLIAIGISLAVGFSSGWKVNSWKYAAEREVAAETFTEAMEQAAKELARIEVKNVTIKQELQTKVIERTVYRDCKHEPDSMLLINKALLNRPIGDSKLP